MPQAFTGSGNAENATGRALSLAVPEKSARISGSTCYLAQQGVRDMLILPTSLLEALPRDSWSIV